MAEAVTLITQFREIYQYREAVRNLVARDLKVRYSHSVLGAVWGLFSPLLMALVYTIVFNYLVTSNISAYPVFILAGLLPWQFFSGTVSSTTGAITTNATLINRVYFPREVLPLANMLSNASNFLLALVMLFVFILVFGVHLGASLLWLPVIFLVELALISGLGLFLSAVNVFFRDTQQIVDILVLAWFFLTPIIYPIEVIKNSSLRLALELLNPMAGLVVAFRHVLYYGDSPDLGLLAVTALESILLLLIGALVFRRLSPSFAEEV
jgi:lipopolysaccharide transport system permease protein